jgi:hypothetical protein
VRKFVIANGILNVGPEIIDWEQDDYTHSDLLKELGVHEFGGEGQGYGVIENDVARIDVDCDGLDRSLEELGFEVRRIRLVKVKDEVRDDEGERESDEDDEDDAEE